MHALPSSNAPELAGFLRRHALRVLVQAAIVGVATFLLSLLIPNKFTAATVMYLAINIVVVTGMRFLERSLAIPGYITGK